MKHTAALMACKGDDDGYLYVFNWDECESTTLLKRRRNLTFLNLQVTFLIDLTYVSSPLLHSVTKFKWDLHKNVFLDRHLTKLNMADTLTL